MPSEGLACAGREATDPSNAFGAGQTRRPPLVCSHRHKEAGHSREYQCPVCNFGRCEPEGERSGQFVIHGSTLQRFNVFPRLKHALYSRHEYGPDAVARPPMILGLVLKVEKALPEASREFT